MVSSFGAVQPFSGSMTGVAGTIPGAKIVDIQPTNVAPRLEFEPGHPDADTKGFVAYPGVDSTVEMVNLMTAVRAYEANVIALNAAKAMTMKAMEIGGSA